MTKYILYTIANILFSFLAWIIAPLLPLFASKVAGPIDNNNGTAVEPRLPSWLSWFMTPDNSLYGDNTFKSNHTTSYWSQVLWLWRNPAYGFDLVLGVPPFKNYQVTGDPLTNDNPIHEGYRNYTVDGAFNSLWVKKIGSSHCTHFEFGWKYDTGSFVFSPRFKSL